MELIRVIEKRSYAYILGDHKFLLELSYVTTNPQPITSTILCIDDYTRTTFKELLEQKFTEVPVRVRFLKKTKKNEIRRGLYDSTLKSKSHDKVRSKNKKEFTS